MSAWLQQQALGGAGVRRLRRRRARPPRGEATGTMVDEPARAGAPPVQLPSAAAPRSDDTHASAAVHDALDRLVHEVDRLCRDLARVGVLVLVVAFLLALSHAWPALRWLLIE